LKSPHSYEFAKLVAVIRARVDSAPQRLPVRLGERPVDRLELVILVLAQCLRDRFDYQATKFDEGIKKMAKWYLS
jgi:hypothetical protein